MSDIDLDHPTQGIDWRRTPGPQIRSRLVLLADAVKAAEAEQDANSEALKKAVDGILKAQAERDAYRAALERVVDFAETSDPPKTLLAEMCRAVLAGDHDQGAQQ